MNNKHNLSDIEIKLVNLVRNLPRDRQLFHIGRLESIVLDEIEKAPIKDAADNKIRRIK